MNNIMVQNSSSSSKSLFLLLLVFFYSTLSNAQVAWDSFYSDNVQVCLQSEKSVVQVSVGTSTTGSYLEAKLPTGFDFAGFDATASNNSNGTIAYGGVVAGWHRFNLTYTNTNPSVVKVVFNQFAKCAAGVSSFTTRDSFRFNNTVTTVSQAGLAFNGTAPDLSITGISNLPSPADVGSIVTRKYTVTNGGFGATRNFSISDKYTSGELAFFPDSFVINPSGVNFAIPASYITIGADTVTVRFDTALIQQIADLDTLFENGENFELQYKVVPQACGNSNVIQSTLLAAWKCPSQDACNWYSVNTGLAIAIPGVPSLGIIRRMNRKTACFNGSSLGDTVWIKNTGVGPATVLNFDVFTMGYPNKPRNDYYGTIDTSMFKFKIGINGAEIKPNMTGTAISTVNSLGCDLRGDVTRVEFQLPILNPGDTLILMTGMSVCDFQYNCGAAQTHLHQPGLPGVGFELDYKNGCQNVTYDGGTQNVIFNRSNPNHQGQNESPTNANENTVANFKQSLRSIPGGGHFTSRAFHEITIKLPAVLKLDSSLFGPGAYPVTITNRVGTVIQPYSQTGPLTFRFRATDLSGTGGLQSALNINLTGFCDTNFCAGIVFWGYDWKVNPDSTNCSNLTRWVCNDYPIAWQSQCKPDCCPAGMINLEFTTNRINYGSPDNDDDKQPDATGNIDLSKIANNVMVAGDTIEYYHKFYIRTNATHPTWEFLYDRFDFKNRASWWSFVSDSVFIDRAVGVDTSFSIVPTTSGDAWITDLSPFGNFNNGDTIIIKLKAVYRITSDQSFNTEVNGYVSHVANPAAADRFACVPIIDNLTSWRTFSFLNQVATLTTNGCAQVRLNSQLYTATGPYGYANVNHFPFEYRNFAYPTEVLQVIPSGYVIDSVELRSTSHSGTTLPAAYAGLNVPFTVVNDTLRYDVSSYYQPNGGLILPTDEGGFLQVTQYISPSCKVQPTVAQPIRGQTSYNTFNSPHSVSSPVGGASYRGSVSIQNNQPTFITNSSIPIAPAYEKIVSWPFSHSNTSAVSVPNNWLFFRSESGQIVIDSVRNGGVLITPNANGFYELGTINGGQTVNLNIFSTQTACNYDSILVFVGYGCQGYPMNFTDTTCSYPARYLFVQPQPASIQTQITALASTPSDPSSPASGVYGSSTVNMCESFPIEMEIQSTQTGNIFNVVEQVNLPSNFGNVGLDYVADSGYIEYPIGSVPRKFSYSGDSFIISTVASGQMLLSMNLIDSVNFDSLKGQVGTGLGNNNTRRAILRWKMKPNCNMVSGDQWTATQFASSPCGDTAAGNATVTSGFPLNLTGISRPYVASVNVESSPDACGPFTTSIAIQKIGTTASLPNDSVFIRLPLTVSNGNIACQGVNCPTPTVPYAEDSFAAYRILKFPFPSGLTTGDTLRYEFPTQSLLKSGCETGQEIKADVFQRVTVLCNGVACPNAVQSLGAGNVLFDLEKPDLSFMNYDAANNYPYEAPYKYLYWGTIMNSSSVSTQTGIVLKTYFDKNGNGRYDADPIDSFIKSTVLTSVIPANGSMIFVDSFTSMTAKPSPTRPLFTVIDTGDAQANCFCSGVAPSIFLNALPVDLLSFDVTKISRDQAQIMWSTASERNADRFDIYRSTDGANFVQVGTVKAVGNSSVLQSYQTQDNISSLTGRVYYKLKQIDMNGTSEWSEVRELNILESKGTLTINPNPSSGQVDLNFGPSMEGLQSIQIYGSTGKLVFQTNATVIENGMVLSLDLSNLPSGVYSVSVNNIVNKLIISK